MTRPPTEMNLQQVPSYYPLSLSSRGETEEVAYLDEEENEDPTQIDFTPGTPTLTRKGTQQSIKNKEEFKWDYSQPEKQPAARFSLTQPYQVHDHCGKSVKTPLDMKKHITSVQLLFPCTYPQCPRGSKLFATIDDLNRHYKSVHNAPPPGIRSFKCFAHGCSKSDKIWPRLDNFKQHLKHLHPNDDPEELLRRSNDWYDQEHPELAEPLELLELPEPPKLPELPTQSHAVRNELRSQERTVMEWDKRKRSKSDSGYFSCPEPSAHDASLNPLIHQLEQLGDRYRETQCISVHPLASPQDESEYNQWRFGKKPFKIELSYSDSVTAAASRRIPENRRGQQSPQPLGSSDGELSFMGSMDSDELAEDWEANLDPVLRLLRSKLITELIDTYIETGGRDENMQHHPYTAATTSDSSPGSCQGSSSHTCLGSSSKPSNATSRGKRQRSSGEAFDEDEDGGEGPRRKKRRETTTSISLDGRFLACPYSKFDPIRYSEQNLSEKNYRGCSSIYLTTTSRLKQHLYRVHKRPDNYCLSCFDVFKSENLLSAHSRARPPCEVQDPRFEERMTTEQVNLIKRWSGGKTQKEAWIAIFEILFPGTPVPTTPFVDSVSPEAILRFLDHFFRQARPRLSQLVRRDLEGRLLLESDQQRILDSALESAIAQLVRETDPRQENNNTQKEVPVEEVQPHDLEDHAIDVASQAPLPQITLPTSLVGGGHVLEDSHEDSSQSWDPGYFDAAFGGDAFQ